jgi:hypothetical protein
LVPGVETLRMEPPSGSGWWREQTLEKARHGGSAGRAVSDWWREPRLERRAKGNAGHRNTVYRCTRLVSGGWMEKDTNTYKNKCKKNARHSLGVAAARWRD